MKINLSDSQKQLLKHAFYILFTIGITLWIFTYLFSVVAIGDILSAIKTSSFYYLAIFFLFSMIMSIGRTWRYMLFLNISGHNPGRTAMFLVTLARNFFSDLLPARLGTLVYIYLTQTRLGISFDAAASSFALSFIFDILVLLLMVIGASLFISSALLTPGIMIASSLMALIICLAILFWLPNGLHWLGANIEKLSRLPNNFREKCKEGLISTGAEINHIKSQKIYTQAIALTVVVRLGKYLSLYALLLAIVVPLGFKVADFPFNKVFLGLCGAELSASLPISGIAGFGAYEGTWAFIFQMLGYEAKLSVLTSVTHHLISQIYGYLLGAAALLTLLLPFFKNRVNSPKLQSDEKRGQTFWFRYTALLFTIGALFFVMISGLYVNGNANPSSTGSNKSNAVTLIHPDKLPHGRIVFMKAGGIYVKELGDDTEKRVLVKGTYPRWSPDGNKIAFVHNHQIGMFNLTDNSTTYLAKAENPRAVVFNDTGKSILYADAETIFSVDIHSRQKKKVAQGKDYRELDVAKKGSLLAVTAKEIFDYYVYIIDLKNDRIKKIARGCSASLSPNGERITVNSRSHLELKLFDRLTGEKTGSLDAPSGYKFDNQFWSNDPDWIVSISEENEADVYVHQVSTNQSWQVTQTGDCDRPDLYINRQ